MCHRVQWLLGQGMLHLQPWLYCSHHCSIQQGLAASLHGLPALAGVSCSSPAPGALPLKVCLKAKDSTLRATCSSDTQCSACNVVLLQAAFCCCCWQRCGGAAGISRASASMLHLLQAAACRCY